MNNICSRVRVRVTLRLTVSQSVCLGVEPRTGLMIRCLLLFDSYRLVIWRAPSLTRGRVCRLSESVSSITLVVIRYIYLHFTCFAWLRYIYMASVSPGSVQQVMPYFW
jgi:hypothetical protein